MDCLLASSTDVHQAGLNLNVFGALSGAFSSKSSKTTEEDGSYTEEREQQSHAKGLGAGNMRANAAAKGEGRKADMKRIADAEE